MKYIIWVSQLTIDRRAFLHWIRNVRPGIETRSRIIHILEEKESCSTKDLADDISLSYNAIHYHLQNLLREKIVVRDEETLLWALSPFSQAKLQDFT